MGFAKGSIREKYELIQAVTCRNTLPLFGARVILPHHNWNGACQHGNALRRDR